MAEVPRNDVPVRPPVRTMTPSSSPPTARADRTADYSPRYYAGEGFSGWAWFAGGLLGLVGLFQVMAGIVALAKSSYYTVPPRTLLVSTSYTTWGWVHLILGLVALVTAGGLVFGSTIARVAGVALCVLSAVVNLAFINAAPFAATLVVILDVFVIYAITVHGGEPKGAR